jgi:hypothetical protein
MSEPNHQPHGYFGIPQASESFVVLGFAQRAGLNEVQRVIDRPRRPLMSCADERKAAAMLHQPAALDIERWVDRLYGWRLRWQMCRTTLAIRLLRIARHWNAYERTRLEKLVRHD